MCMAGDGIRDPLLSALNLKCGTAPLVNLGDLRGCSRPRSPKFPRKVCRKFGVSTTRGLIPPTVTPLAPPTYSIQRPNLARELQGQYIDPWLG